MLLFDNNIKQSSDAIRCVTWSYLRMILEMFLSESGRSILFSAYTTMCKVLIQLRRVNFQPVVLQRTREMGPILLMTLQ